jgi:hypothetical protein
VSEAVPCRAIPVQVRSGHVLETRGDVDAFRRVLFLFEIHDTIENAGFLSVTRPSPWRLAA